MFKNNSIILSYVSNMIIDFQKIYSDSNSMFIVGMTMHFSLGNF